MGMKPAMTSSGTMGWIGMGVLVMDPVGCLDVHQNMSFIFKKLGKLRLSMAKPNAKGEAIQKSHGIALVQVGILL